jgi:cytoskeleton protein RodZ
MMSDADPRDYRSLGDLLRDAREEKQVSFEQLNESTRISVRVLKALEQDDLEAASGIIYVRGFVRTLAAFYDLDPEWLGAKLDALAGETSRPVLPVDDEDDVIAGPVPDPVVEEVPVETGPKWEVESTRIRHVGAKSTPRVSRNLILGLVAVLILAIVLVLWMGFDRSTGGGRAENESTALTDPVYLEEWSGPGVAESASRQSSAEDRADADLDPESDAVPAEIPEVGTHAADADMTRAETTPTEPRSIPTETESIPAETSTSPVRDDQPAASSGPPLDTAERDAPDDSPSADPVPQRMVEVEDPVSGTSTGLSSVLRPAEDGALPPMELRILVDGPVEVTISSDGADRKTKMMNQGEEWRFRGSDHFTLAVTDPAVVSIEIDGRPRRLPLNWTGEEMALWRPETDGGDR